MAEPPRRFPPGRVRRPGRQRKVAPIKEGREPPRSQKSVDVRRVTPVDARIADKNVEGFGLQIENPDNR
jgi:hypothetical protein